MYVVCEHRSTRLAKQVYLDERPYSTAVSRDKAKTFLLLTSTYFNVISILL